MTFSGEIHPAAEFFPLMSDDEFGGLVESIREHGLRDPIATLDGMILDGRNRARACAHAGVEVRYVEAELNGGGPVEYVFDKNLHRRQLTSSQKAAVAAHAMDALAVEARERQRHHAGTAPGRPKTLGVDLPQVSSGRAREIAAARVGVGSSLVQHAKSLQKYAPELFKKVEAGELTVSAAKKKAGLTEGGGVKGAHRPRVAPRKKLRQALGPLHRLLRDWDETQLDGTVPAEARRLLKIVQEVDAALFEVERALQARTVVPRALK